MKLTRARVTDFRSVEDSNEFSIGDLTCLVGKNESGKTAILEALYGLNPYHSFDYDKTRDYPRRHLNRFNERHPDGESPVVETLWELSDEDMCAIEETFGEKAISSEHVSISTGFDYEYRWGVEVNESAIIKALVNRHNLYEEIANPLLNLKTVDEVAEWLIGKQEEDSHEEPFQIQEQDLLNDIQNYPDGGVEEAVIELLTERIPKMFYTSHYDRISGKISVNKLSEDRSSGDILTGDQIFLDFFRICWHFIGGPPRHKPI